jgi:hypothetical protein
LKGIFMKIYKVVFTVLSIFLIFWLGCSVGNEPDNQSRYSEADNSLAIAEGQMDLMDAGGHPVRDCKAIFSLGWKEIFVPRLSTSETAGHAFAVAFDELLALPPRPFTGGIDMGSVFINYQTNRLELRKMTVPGGGVIYSMGHRPHPGVSGELEFIPGISYQFEVTGSTGFDPLQIDLMSPPGLLSITSHSLGDTVALTGNLTLNWTGGHPDSGLVVHVHPAHLRPVGPNPEPGQMPLPGSRPPMGGPGERGLMPPPPPISPNAIVIVMENNTGTCTVSSEDLQELINQTGGRGIICGLSQITVVEVDHNGEPVIAVLHNGDRVGLIVE